MATPLWQPDASLRGSTRIARFAELVGVPLAEIQRWSIAEPAAFWSAIWDFCEVTGEKGTRIIEPGVKLRDTRFFPQAHLNFAENLLRRHDDTIAIRFHSEHGVVRNLTWAELSDLVSRLQQAMRASGVEAGDRVAAYLPNVPEAVAIMLAAASIGAIFTSTSPDFGVSGVIDRFGQTEPVMLFGVDGYAYGGKTHDCRDKVDEIQSALPSVRDVIIVPYIYETAGTLAGFLEPYVPVPVEFEQFPFDHPLYVLYSSGTTGKPKCIVHRAGGILLQHIKEHQLHCDLSAGDSAFYFTTTGWMMWNWLVSALGSGVTLVLYDGSPFHPDGNRLFDLAEVARPQLFGVSAKFIESVANAGLRPVETHDLSSIRTMCSTGSPLSPEGFAFVSDHIKPDVHLVSFSGGTDLCACLVTGNPTEPVWAGEIQGPALGLDIDIVGDDGRPLMPGEQGELVCRNAFPSMPLSFWDDPGDERYDRAYFEQFAGMWHQGDFAERTPHGGFIIHGRSDATLNPGGVRIGTAEIYRQLEGIDEVTEGLVVGQRRDADTRVVLFVTLREGTTLTDRLQDKIRSAIRVGASPRHVPAVIATVDDIPRTRSGKIVELAVRDVVHGEVVKNIDALANPEALEQFRDRPELD